MPKSSTSGTYTSSPSFNMRPMSQYSMRRPKPAECLNFPFFFYKILIL
jgi:hypothetical protein